MASELSLISSVPETGELLGGTKENNTLSEWGSLICPLALLSLEIRSVLCIGAEENQVILINQGFRNNPSSTSTSQFLVKNSNAGAKIIGLKNRPMGH